MGTMLLPVAIGIVVGQVPSAFQMPLGERVSLARARVPIGRSLW
jgi:hypothetical protein